MISVDNKTESVMRSYTGHGMIEKHPAGLTIAGVMGHELGHINEARSHALASGGEVISQNIQIDVAFEGAKLIATSGRATTITVQAKAVSNYKNNMEAFEFEKKQAANNFNPITTSIQSGRNAKFENTPAEDDIKADIKAGELSTLLSQQKQKLENKIQQLNSAKAPAAPGVNNTAAEKNNDIFTEQDAPDAETTAANEKSGRDADAENAKRKTAAEKLTRIREQITRIDNILASLKIARSVKMLDGILQAVTGSNVISGGDITDFFNGNAQAPASSNRKSASENMIVMIEESLRGMLININA